MSKKLFVILGFTSAILAVILAVTPSSHLAVAPIIIAFISGFIILVLSKKQNTKTKIIQYIFILVIIALGLTLYKAVYNNAEVGHIEQLEPQDEENLEDSKETLEELEIDEDF